MMRRSPYCSRTKDLDVHCRHKLVADKVGWPDIRNERGTRKLNEREETLHKSMTFRLLNLETVQVKSYIRASYADSGEEAHAELVVLVDVVDLWIESIIAW